MKKHRVRPCKTRSRLSNLDLIQPTASVVGKITVATESMVHFGISDRVEKFMFSIFYHRFFSMHILLCIFMLSTILSILLYGKKQSSDQILSVTPASSQSKTPNTAFQKKLAEFGVLVAEIMIHFVSFVTSI